MAPRTTLIALLTSGLFACAEDAVPAPDASLGATGGALTALCGGPDDVACPDGSFCEGHAGQCEGGYGVCRPLPATCKRAWAPVCGCDGVTYPNDCKRRMAGVGKAGSGPCPKAGGFGDPCSSDADCESGLCVETGAGPVCTAPCLDTCPQGWSCSSVGQGPDVLFACVPVDPACDFDQVPVDTDGDGLADGCAQACQTVCDCYGKGGFSAPCELDCATCDNYWTCHAGACYEGCGPVPASSQECLGGQVGDPCGAGTPGCAEGLACCYPCGIPGCQFQCQVPCDQSEPWCEGGCPLLP